MGDRDIGRGPNSNRNAAQADIIHLFGLFDAPLQAVQCIPNAFLDLGREDEHFQSDPIIITLRGTKRTRR
jgi:hypothetical protein